MPNLTPDLTSAIHHIFVDYENVHEIDLAIIGSKAVTFTLLVGPTRKTLDVELVEKLFQHAATVQLVRLTSSGRNALDFTLVYYVGRAVAAGLRTRWYPSGAKQSEANIKDGKLHGTFRKWHENGTLSEQAEFVAGQPEGVSHSYFPSGYLKAEVTMQAGKPAGQSFWKEAERKE